MWLGDLNDDMDDICMGELKINDNDGDDTDLHRKGGHWEKCRRCRLCLVLTDRLLYHAHTWDQNYLHNGGGDDDGDGGDYDDGDEAGDNADDDDGDGDRKYLKGKMSNKKS